VTLKIRRFERRDGGLLRPAPDVRVASKHGLRDVPGERHNHLFRYRGALREPRDDRVPAIVPTEVKSGARIFRCQRRPDAWAGARDRLRAVAARWAGKTQGVVKMEHRDGLKQARE